MVGGAAPRPLAAAESPAKPPAKVAALMAAYRGTTNVSDQLKSLKALGSLRSPAVDQFLLQEFSILDATREPGSRLAGGILRLWADKPTAYVLPYLVYEGLFHDDADVVRACAGGIAKSPEEAKALMSTGRATRGTDPGEELAADLIRRMEERSDLLHALEKVLVLWSGKQREGYRADVNLQRAPKDEARTAALAFWKGWYEERFRKKR